MFCVKKRKTECAGNSFSLPPDPQSTCSPPHPCSVPQKARPCFQVDLANSRRLKNRRRKTRTLIPLVVSWPTVPVQCPLHSTQCWGSPALLCPFRHRGGNGLSLCLWSTTIFSWFPHPADFLVSRPFVKLSPIIPFEHTIICFPDPGLRKNSCSKGNTRHRGKYIPTALAAVCPLPQWWSGRSRALGETGHQL